MTSDIMTQKEVAKYLKMSNRSIQDWSKGGYIPAFKLVGSWRYRKSEIDNWLETKRNS
jgi:PTS system nitrogen regulatory IIA component